MDKSFNLLDDLDIEIPEAAAGDRDGAGQAARGGAHFFGPYQLIRDIGVGGVARVLRARHIHPRYAEQTFAVKVLHPELSTDPKVIALFRREAYVLSLLKHPNIVQTFEAGEQDDRLFIAMEYIDGRDLDNMLQRCKRMRIALPLHIGMYILGEVVSAMIYAHELAGHDGVPVDLVHRDVNPANVFLSYDGRIKLGDFGVAQIVAGRGKGTGELAGKIGYFAPEQLLGGEVDQRADIFALGVMMFEMLCGTHLFEGNDADALMRANKKAKIPKPSKLNPNIPPALEKAMLMALERKPEARVPSARRWLEFLQPFIPMPDGMRLAVASMMRKVFLKEHIQELQINEGLAGIGPDRGSGQLIYVVSGNEKARVAFNELLISRGYRVSLHAGCEGLNFGSGPAAPELVMVDVSSSGFDRVAFRTAVQRVGIPFPIIAVSEGADLRWIRAAHELGSCDMLFKPYNIERVLTSVRASLTRSVAVGWATDDEKKPGSRTCKVRKIILLSQDPELLVRLSIGLSERGLRVDVSPTGAEVLSRTDHTSYHSVVFDSFPPSPSDRLFAGLYRARPGMGLVPIVYLVDDNARRAFGGMLIDRCALQRRSGSPEELADLLGRLHRDTSAGRTFVRYKAEFDVELRFGGRVFKGMGVDISRGGVMLQSTQMPPVGAEVGVSLHLPNLVRPVEAVGCVIRVDLDSASGQHRAHLGVEFRSFAGRSEAELIAFLRDLDERMQRGSAPPPPSNPMPSAL